MHPWFHRLNEGLTRGWRNQGPRRRRAHLLPGTLETLEDRCVPSAAAAQHELLLSVDGLHNADLSDPQLASALTHIENLQDSGVNYTNAFTTSPSDSFSGTLSYLTGAGPGTTGVFYDDSQRGKAATK